MRDADLQGMQTSGVACGAGLGVLWSDLSLLKCPGHYDSRAIRRLHARELVRHLAATNSIACVQLKTLHVHNRYAWWKLHPLPRPGGGPCGPANARGQHWEQLGPAPVLPNLRFS